MHLPESVHVDDELMLSFACTDPFPHHVRASRVGLARVTGRDQAIVDGNHGMRAVPAHAPTSVPIGDEGGPGPPAQPVLVARHRLDLESHEYLVVLRQPTDAPELLEHDGRLQTPLRRQGGVLEVAATATSGTSHGARGSDSVFRRAHHLHRVTTHEAVALGALGQLDHHSLTG
ncbi:hypothetical protein [Nocardioides alcanivorans]|uniref:hypothetical protein n=1 Tax=Nocardioides alcanivorans TaxID=2897352 RepID=UPI00289C2712|nr:hypothetical protein [Nocardioides alcanivorans]